MLNNVTLVGVCTKQIYLARIMVLWESVHHFIISLKCCYVLDLRNNCSFLQFGYCTSDPQNTV